MAVSLLDSIPAPASKQTAGGVLPRLQLPGYDIAAALRLERELGISHVLSQILVRRGQADPAAVRAFLAAAERHDPALFAGMDHAVDLVWRHLRAGTRIVVHGDYDVDGVCATAVLVRALRALGADVGWYLPSRIEDGYGLAAATVERLASRGTNLLITVDCGITAVDEVNHARMSGMDVIITDHHRPRADGRLPDCPIVHPEISGYPFSGLCGTAVAHKLAEALGADTVGPDLELVALATVADLVPLESENRRLVRDGLALMAGTERPGLRALMAVSRTDPSGLDASALGFRLAPRINAAGRMRRADAALELLLTDDPERARTVALELDQVNAQRRAVEEQIRWEAEKLATEMGERSVYVLASEGWHQGVVGIVASRIVERFNRPAVLIALDGDGAPGHGSGRSIPGFDLLAALQAGAGELAGFGGHRAAAGLTIEPDRIDAFRELVEAHADAVLTPDLLTATERVDAVASGAELTLELAEELAQLEPSGIGNPAPVLLVPGARFDGLRTMSDGKHARFSVISGGARAAGVSFGCDGKLPVECGVPADASFRLERNVWRGVTEPRLVLRQARALAADPIHVISEYAGAYLDVAFEELFREFGTDMDGAHLEGRDRVVVDRRGVGPLAVIAEAIHAAVESSIDSSAGVLVVCGDAERRAKGLEGRTGGFALVSHAMLAEEPYLAEEYRHVVVLDPPLSAAQQAAVRYGEGFTYLAWGDAEIRFTQQMHEQEYGLRASLVALYRSLRERGRVAGEELEHLLRGDGSQPRSAALAGRLLRVFAELELVSLDPDLPAMAIAGAQPTQLEHSAAYLAYADIYEEGQRFLKAATAPHSA